MSYFRFWREKWIGLTLVLAATVATALAAEESGSIMPPLKFTAAMPVVKAMAKRENIPFEEIEAASESSALRPGDSVTALVTLTYGEELTQWLVYLACVELTEKEKGASPRKELRMYTSAGTEIAFRDERSAIAVRVLGPYKKRAELKESLREAKDVSARMTVNAEYLGLGLDRGCESVLVLRESLQKNPGLARPAWEVGPKPFPKKRAEVERKLADAVGLTPERERAAVGAVPALLEFWRLASRTPGLQDITRSIAQVSWWSIVAKGGDVKARLKPHFASAYRIKLEGNVGGNEQGYGFPFELRVNDRPALSCQAVVASARPPLMACAGVLALAAQSPDGQGAHLMISVVDARSKTQGGENPSSTAGTQ